MVSLSTTAGLPTELPAGTIAGRYVVDGWVRDGGMAALYRAHHRETGAKVALKVALPRLAEHEVYLARFRREAEVMGRLCGAPHVVTVFDVGELSDGRGYLAMEWV